MIEVLVAHKEDNIGELIRDMILSRGDYEVTVTSYVVGALTTIRDRPISLAILDSKLFGLLGCGVIRETANDFKRNLVIAVAVDDLDEVGNQADVKFKMMDLPAKLDEILALANSRMPAD